DKTALAAKLCCAQDSNGDQNFAVLHGHSRRVSGSDNHPKGVAAANKQLSWRSHAARLSVLRDHVNEMGRSLAELEAMKPMANQTQTLAIENARPHLVSVASNLTDAIDLVNENRWNVYWSDYGEAVRDVYSHADALHTKLDTILEYEKGKARMENLELPTSMAGQS
ncbi:MAG TPA: hypothetical protein VMG82_38825, partial [Candidatus Sulfotelmatobacter sp.]|nr:hypothetical protein [Candidatus Sulfotelmatobacter sp.]